MYTYNMYTYNMYIFFLAQLLAPYTYAYTDIKDTYYMCQSPLVCIHTCIHARTPDV